MALFLSFALEPAVQWFVKRGWRRGRATGLIMLLLFLVGLLLLALIIPAIITGFTQLVDSAPALVDRLSGWLRPLGIDISTESLITELQRNADSIISTAQNIAGLVILGVASSILGGLFKVATVGLFTFYLVADGPRVRRIVLSRMPPARQEHLLFVLEQAISQTGGYFYSRLLLAVINGTGMYIALRLNNVPFAAPLAIFEGVVAEFIPIVGTYIGGAVPILVAFLTSTPAGHLGPGLRDRVPADRELSPEPQTDREDDGPAPGGRVRRGADRRVPRRDPLRLPRAAGRRRDPGRRHRVVPPVRGGGNG